MMPARTYADVTNGFTIRVVGLRYMKKGPDVGIFVCVCKRTNDVLHSSVIRIRFFYEVGYKDEISLCWQCRNSMFEVQLTCLTNLSKCSGNHQPDIGHLVLRQVQ